MEYCFRSGGEDYRVKLESSGGEFHVEIGGRKHAVHLLGRQEGILDLELGRRRFRFHLATDRDLRHLALEGRTYRLEKTDPGPRPRSLHHADHGLEARMPGLVRAVRVAEGDRVERGQTLVVLEAMKMEIRVTAPEVSVIGKVRCREGQQVERGQVLVELEPG